METVGSTWMWLGFFAFVIIMLLIDLFLLGGRKAHKVSIKEAALWSVAWVILALLFNAALWWYLGETQGREIADAKALEFLTGYLVEKSLAVDNVFVWLMIFSYFAVPPEYQRRVLLYGVLGALLMRTIMILAGAWLLAHFHWILYVFGAFLVFTGIKMMWFSEHQPDLEQNPLVRWLRGHMRMTTTFHQEKFFVVQNGLRYATPLFLVLIMVEITDLIFAVDSIPAIFAITSDPFIVLTSNIFAILGLRAMYFLLADFADRFVLLKYGLALVLIFIGSKMLLLDVYKIPITWSLVVVASIIAISVILSLRYTRER
ncbi:MAG TPA: TerC family protein [Candidatus Thiothrix moscowensis]|uniref:TerC family protein n=1 Tax=unclassified Thiothrix TaxID=2636184 RepID=UPI0025D09530|nr:MULTISPECIES: TerC family protein [unclassified Thiothrix]HRJ54400.1 TerC family protein [Candidatus Thiothrix moscowensis]HRJ94736.1 TerC family protein [Candidatus Thiothrix moscowensis]